MAISFTDNKDRFKWMLSDFLGSVDYERSLENPKKDFEIVDSYINNQCSMEQGMKDYYDYLKEESRRNMRLINAIKSVKGKTFYKYLLEIIEESEGIKGLAQIVKEPVGKFQSEKYGRQIDGIWVEQRSVGDTGDSFEGTVCVKIKDNKFLKFSYSM